MAMDIVVMSGSGERRAVAIEGREGETAGSDGMVAFKGCHFLRQP